MLGLVAGTPRCDSNMSLVGTPCVPTAENDPTFLGFDVSDIHVGATPDQVGAGDIFCLVNHFRGRVTCPYGQDPTGTELPRVDGASGGPFPEGGGPCMTPSNGAVTGDPSADPVALAQVEPQCTDRRAAKTVFWTCLLFERGWSARGQHVLVPRRDAVRGRIRRILPGRMPFALRLRSERRALRSEHGVRAALRPNRVDVCVSPLTGPSA